MFCFILHPSSFILPMRTVLTLNKIVALSKAPAKTTPAILSGTKFLGSRNGCLGTRTRRSTAPHPSGLRDRIDFPNFKTKFA